MSAFKFRRRKRTVISSGAIATYGLTAGWATFGIPVPMGVAQTSLKIGSLTTQCDIRNTWADGSIKYAVLTANVLIPGNYDITPSAESNGTPYTPTWPSASVSIEILTGSPSGTPGTVYTATLPSFDGANSTLSGALVREARVTVTPQTAAPIAHPFLRVRFDVRSYNDSSHRIDAIGENIHVETATCNAVDVKVTFIINGATVYQSSGVVTGSGTIAINQGQGWNNYTTSSPHGLSKGQFFRFTSGLDSGQVRQVTMVESTMKLRSTYGPKATIDAGSNVSGLTYDVIDFRWYAGARWRLTGTVSLTESDQTVDFTPFFSVKAIPEYLATVPNAAGTTLNPYMGPDPYKPGRVGIVSMPGDDTGSRPEIGPYPSWQAIYITHPSDFGLRTTVLKEGNAAGSHCIHWGDTVASGLPLVSLTDHASWRPTTMGNSRNGVDTASDMTYGVDPAYNIVTDFPHTGSYAFLPYLLTGDQYYLDEMRYWANGAMLGTYDGGGSPSKDSRGGSAGYLGMFFNAARGWAWGLRNLIDVATWMPDADTYKSYFASKLTTNLQTADSYANASNGSPWDGFLHDGYSPQWTSSNESGPYPNYEVVSPWQAYYLLWAFDHAIGLGYTDGAAMRLKIARMAMAVYNEPTISEHDRSTYRLFITSSPSIGTPFTYYPTIAAAWAAESSHINYPSLNSRPLTTFYGFHVRLAYQVGVKLGLSNASAALAWINAYVSEPVWGSVHMSDMLATAGQAMWALKDPS